jgi:hypothetical protein
MPNLLGTKSLESPNLIPLPIINKAWVEEEAQVGTSENPKLIFEVGKASWDSSHPESSKYNLRPISKGFLDFPGKVVGGLGFIDEKKQNPNQRGRKYYMSMAQKQASSQVRCGKQLSLIGALRVSTLVRGLNDLPDPKL